MMQVIGGDGVNMEDIVTYQRSLFLDMVYLQQDAFDDVDYFTQLTGLGRLGRPPELFANLSMMCWVARCE